MVIPVLPDYPMTAMSKKPLLGWEQGLIIRIVICQFVTGIRVNGKGSARVPVIEPGVKGMVSVAV